MKLKSFIENLRIPAEKAKHKEFFIGIKNSKRVSDKLSAPKETEEKNSKSGKK